MDEHAATLKKDLEMYCLRLMAGVMAAATVTTGWAFQPLITDDTGTQGKAGNQLELALNRDRAEQAGLTNTASVVPLTYTRGLGEGVDVFLSVSYARLGSSVPGTDASGAGNPSLGFKWRLFDDQGSKTSLAVKPELRLPLSAFRESAGLGTGRSSYGLALILTQETGFGAVHGNLAVGHNHYLGLATSPGPDTQAVRASVAPVWAVSPAWRLALDIGAEVEKDAASNQRIHSHFIEIGAVFSPHGDLDFAFGIIRRVDRGNPGTTTNAVTSGVTWRFQ